MKLRLVAIAATSNSSYRVSLAAEDEEAVRDFVFIVDRGSIDVVVCPADLARYLNSSTGPLRPIYAAIHAFDAARVIDVPTVAPSGGSA